MEVTANLNLTDQSVSRERLAVIFPGQGSQLQGMGHTLIRRYPEARLRLDEFSTVVATDLYELLCGGPVTADPVRVHLAMVSYGILAWEWLTAVRKLQPVMVAGHSLGEITALCCAGVLSPEDALGLALARGRFIAEASLHSPGGMRALVGAPLAEIQSLIRQWSGATGGAMQVWEANYNSPQQLIVAGETEALQALETEMQARGITVISLPTAGAFHTPFMRPAAAELAETAKGITFHEPRIPVISSMTGRLLTNHRGVAVHLALQLVRPVQWLAVMQFMRRSQVTTVIEAGPENGVLSQLALHYQEWNVHIASLYMPVPG